MAEWLLSKMNVGVRGPRWFHYQTATGPNDRLTGIRRIPIETGLINYEMMDDPDIFVGGEVFTYKEVRETFPNTLLAQMMVEKRAYALHFDRTGHYHFLLPSSSLHVGLTQTSRPDIPNPIDRGIIQGLHNIASGLELHPSGFVDHVVAYALQCIHKYFTKKHAGKTFIYRCNHCGFTYSAPTDGLHLPSFGCFWPGQVRAILQHYKAMIFTGPINDIGQLKALYY